MDPLTLGAIAIVLLMASCSSSKDGTKDVPLTDTASLEDAPQIDDIVSTDSVSLSVDSGSHNDINAFVSGDTYDTTPEVISQTNACPAFPLQGKIKLFAQPPCEKNAVITDLDKTGFGVCTDFAQKHVVFQWDETGIVKSAALSIIPDQIEQGPDGKLAITGFDSKTQTIGVARLDSIVAQPNWLPFEAVTIDTQTFVPNFPKGMAYASGNLFVATGDISFTTGKPVYAPGAVLVYSGNVAIPKAFSSQGQNPTSMTAVSVHGQTFVAVVNTGNYNVPVGNPENKGSLVLIDPVMQKIIQSIALPRAGFGLSGEIAMGGGKIAIGSADNSGQTILFQLDNLAAAAMMVPDKIAPAGEFHFITTTILSDSGEYLISADYNSGKLKTWNIAGTTPQSLSPDITLDTNLIDNQGIGDGFCRGGKFYIVVGNTITEVE